MARFVALLLVLFAACCLASDCSTSHRYSSHSEAGHFGCDTYGDRSTISWLIQIQDTTRRILLEFDSFDTEANYDFVKIYDGDSDQSPLLGSYSGSVIPGPFTSQSSNIYIVFITDEYVEGSGFAAHWTSFQVAEGINKCSESSNVALEGPEGDFGCNGYANSISSSWQITGNEGERIVLSFDNFNTEENYDVLKVYNGADNSAELLGTFSGSDLPPPVTASGHQLYVTFTSDYSLAGRGFTAGWTSLVEFADACYNNTNTVLLAPEGYLGCPYGYGNGVYSTWLINLVGDVLIQMDFLSLNLEANVDFLDVYDGNNANAPKINSYTGMTTPRPIRSSTNQLFVVLRSDGNNTAGGFTASYQSVHALQSTGCARSGIFTLTDPQESLGCDGYASGVTEEWLLVAQSDKGQVINLVWNTFDTQDGHDYVTVYDGENDSAPLLYTHSGSSMPDPVQSTGQNMYVKFVADDDHVQGTGFSAIYESVSAPIETDAHSCQTSHTSHLTDQEGDFGCNGYANNVQVDWQIEVQAGFQILLNFDSFFTESARDVLRIYDGPTNDANLLGTYSGAFRPPSLSSSSNYLYLLFVSDEGVTRSGFSASYSSVFSGNDAGGCFESASHQVSGESGSFGCAGYGGDVEVSWVVTTEPGTNVMLEFTEFQTEFNYDIVTIYDGPNANAAVLAVHSGYTVPQPVHSNYNQVYVVFTSDANVNYDGFTMTYRAVPVTNVGVPACTSSTAQTLREPAGQFGCSGYENNVETSWSISQPRGNQITLRFTRFDTEQLYDYVKVFDGSNSHSTLLGTYSGSMVPAALTSTSNQLYVTFHSDSSMSTGFQGFIAEYAAFVTGDDGDDTITKCSLNADNTLTKPSGQFGCNGYVGDVTVTWSISSFANIFVNFEHFSTEPIYDVVTVYDGTDDKAPILATYSGSEAAPVSSTGSNMFIKFTSDSSVNRHGFTASYATAIRVEE